MSRDSGSTWFEIKKGPHIYEIGDHGGIILMASNKEPTTEAYYTWNEGESWEVIQISDHPIMVENIVVDPASVSTQFLIYGEPVYDELEQYELDE